MRPESTLTRAGRRPACALILTTFVALLGALVLAAGPAGAAGTDRGAVMAKLGPGATSQEAAAVARRTGLTLAATMPEIGWATYEYAGNRATAHAALRSDPAVFRIDFARPGDTLERQQNYGDPWPGPPPAELWAGVTPNDQLWGRRWTVGFNEPILVTDFTVDWNGAPSPAWGFWHWTFAAFPEAWAITRSSSATAIAVIDGEFDLDHPDLAAKFRPGMNFDSGSPAYRTGDVRFGPGQDPETFHGTHVAGIIGAQTDNGAGVSGACWDCTMIPYKIGFGGNAAGPEGKFVSDLVEAVLAASATDAVAISMSVGTKVDYAPLREAIALAYRRGKVMVASAGNSQQSEPNIANYPSHYPGVIAVAATTPADTIADFSLHNPNVDVAAPGHPIVSTTGAGDPGADFGPIYRSMSGTSMAAPMVAGLVGLMKSVRPDLTPDEVDALLKQTARDRGTPGHDPVYGAGIIHAGRAVQAARDYVRPPGAGPAAGAALRLTAVRVAPAVAVRGLPAQTTRTLTIRATLNAPARLRVVFERQLPGLRRGTRCVAPTAALRRARARACVRYVSAGAVARPRARAGVNTVAITRLRVGSRALAAGRYRVTITATASGRTTARAQRALTVRQLPPPRRR